MSYEPAAWHDFFVMLGGASAALAGLVFVGLSIHARAVASDPLYRLRARNLTAGIVYITVVSALVLTPTQGVIALGVEVLVGGCVMTGLFMLPLLRFRDRIAPELRVRMGIAIAACVLCAVAGASLIAGSGGGLTLLVPAAVGGLLMNVFGAWSLLLGLARSEDQRLA